MPDEPKDVLIHADPEALDHKWAQALATNEIAYWRVNGKPRQTALGRTVYFEDDGSIYARGTICKLERGRLCFEGAEPVELACPVDPPTRGFTVGLLDCVGRDPRTDTPCYSTNLS